MKIFNYIKYMKLQVTTTKEKISLNKLTRPPVLKTHLLNTSFSSSVLKFNCQFTEWNTDNNLEIFLFLSLPRTNCKIHKYANCKTKVSHWININKLCDSRYRNFSPFVWNGFLQISSHLNSYSTPLKLLQMLSL